MKTDRYADNRQPMEVDAAWPPESRPMTFRVGLRTFTVYGGPFAERLGGNYDLTVGLGQRGQSAGPAARSDIRLDWPDFGVPKDVVPIREAAWSAILGALAGKKVYVGCGWGRGRTGTFLAIMLKMAGVREPVTYVREHYNPMAIETGQQVRFVDDCYVQPQERELGKIKRASFWGIFPYRWIIGGR